VWLNSGARKSRPGCPPNVPEMLRSSNIRCSRATMRFVPRTQRSAISALRASSTRYGSSRSGALQIRGPACWRLEVTGVPVLRSGMKNAASRPGHVIHASLPSLIRQTIPFARVFRRVMDTRVPATPRLRRAFQCQAGEALAKTASPRMTQSMLRRRSQILIHRFKQPSARILAPPRELGF
jgi:hypothetical protein